ncbi:MAG: thiamine pyrophosphate-dependent dehydrogenase E1 component subunit alpha [Chloroflexi bacterium]|nr:thiamine pyrophosphate-dependent dehydrogenase E1 component subunit alpha [Chloroflexota bacterium]
MQPATTATPGDQQRGIGLSDERLKHMFWQMLAIRGFDTRIHDLFNDGLIRGSTHPYVGMEAVAVGACAALKDGDYIASTHRGHGHCIAKDCDLSLMMAELLGKATGYCKGKGGSMHIADLDKGMLGANGIVGGGMGLATGAALACQLRGNDNVSIAFFGDGAINQGAFYECANMAAAWKLPIVYLCENNQYAMSASIVQMTGLEDLSVRAQAFGFPGVTVDGMNVLAVYETAAAAVARARRGDGPSLIVAKTYRLRGHNVGDTERYRTREEVSQWQAMDPIPAFRAQLIERGVLTEASATALAEQVQHELAEAEQFARDSPEPALETLMEDVYA